MVPYISPCQHGISHCAMIVYFHTPWNLLFTGDLTVHC